MPTYVYKCALCAIEVEEQRKMSQANDPLACPLCGEMLSKAITPFAMTVGHAAAVQPTSTPSPMSHGRNCGCCTPPSWRR